MTLRRLLWSIVPHKCKYGRAYDIIESKVPGVSLRVKSCKSCGHTKEVRRRGRKAA